MTAIEAIRAGQTLLAYIVRADAAADSTTFFTGYDAVVPHVHLPVVRTVVGTSELLMGRSGRCIVDIYDDDRALVTSRELEAGDLVLSLSGGHGFRMLEGTVLLEGKQGPYSGQAEKERFDPSGEPRPE